MKKTELEFSVEEIIGTLKESSKHDWNKAIMRISWNDRPPTLDIRNFNFSKNKSGKGISLTDEETDSLVDMLLENDYGSMTKLKEVLKRRESIFTTEDDGVEYYNIGLLS